MKKSGVITIILLVLVVVALSIALVVTNMHKDTKVENTDTEDVTDVNNTKKDEVAKQLDNDGEVAQRAYDIVDGLGSIYGLNNGVGTYKDLTNNEILLTAYEFMDNSLIEDTGFIEKRDNTVYGRFKASDLAASVKAVFGDIEYKNEDFSGRIAPVLLYVPEEDTYYRLSGVGGGGAFSYVVHGINKVEEYEDRYEVTEKMLFVKSNDLDGGTRYEIKTWSSEYSPTIAYFGSAYSYHEKDGTYYNSLDDVIEGVNDTNSIRVLMTKGSGEALAKQIDNAQKLLTKYAENATELKHTFMKSEDGSFYWVKTEIVK